MAANSPGGLYFCHKQPVPSTNITTSLAKAFLLPTQPHLATGVAQLLPSFPGPAPGLASPVEKWENHWIHSNVTLGESLFLLASVS